LDDDEVGRGHVEVEARRLMEARPTPREVRRRREHDERRGEHENAHDARPSVLLEASAREAGRARG
jgi:hypothetical protein